MPVGPAMRHDLGAAIRGGLGQRKPHAAARPVADEPDGVDVLDRRTGGDENPTARERLPSAEQRLDGIHDVGRLGQPALPYPPAREIAVARLDERRPSRRETRDVLLHGAVFPHVRVHRGREEDAARVVAR